MPHNPLGPICTAATVHLAAAVPNFAWLEVRTSPTEQLGFDNSDLFPVQLHLEGSSYPVPETPGLGVEFNDELAAERAFQFWEAPHLHRRDGSYTNW
jgi:galactonate dehydratase